MDLAAEGVPGISPDIQIGRMKNCAGNRSSCESPYCPACSGKNYHKLQRRLMRVAKEIPQSQLRFATFVIEDCSGFELRGIAKATSAIARDMLRSVPSLNGWFMRQEAKPSSPGRYHPHIHVLMDVKAGYSSGRNCMSVLKWRGLWEAALPDDLHSVQQKPVVIKSVYDVAGIVKYLCKSPWSKAHGETFEEKLLSVIRISDQISDMARLRRYASSGTLSVTSDN